jgi:sugar phosphate isomerase/epimerase
MYILGRTQPLSQYPIVECLEVIKRLGFDGVEICLEHPDLDPETLTVELVRQVAATVQELGLSPHSVSYHKDYTYDDRMFEQTCNLIPVTHEFNTHIFVFGGGPKRAGDTDAWPRMIERTKELVRIAEEHHVILAQEFEPDFIIGSTVDLQRLFDEIPSPNLQANVDLGHVFLCDPDPFAAIASLKGRIAHGHVENMAAGLHKHLLPQEGDMDLPRYFEVLKKIGFRGGLALDLYDVDYEAVSPQAIAYLKTCI